jgi:hypothetical protein
VVTEEKLFEIIEGKEFCCPSRYKAPSIYPAVKDSPTERNLLTSALPAVTLGSSIFVWHEKMLASKNKRIPGFIICFISEFII